ncbi:Ferric-chelate reductase 1 [Trichostrongylus colubriformis]|uniref:ascorbate ferrireductase (transmembrane) n=1 Tax=Trichostrongylus colubriformis TaxID=6319 RepID=A0AAN8FKY9_TRICO
MGFCLNLCLLSTICGLSILASSAFDASSCGKTKDCLVYENGLAFSFKVVSPSFIDIELAAQANDTNRFVGVTFVDGDKTPSIECSSINGQPPAFHVPSIDENPENLQNPSVLAFRQQYLSNVSGSLQNDTLYCSARVLVTGQNNTEFFSYSPSKKYGITLTSGAINRGTRVVTDSHSSSPLFLDAIKPITTSHGLDITVRRRLNKAHAILMVLSWLFFVPSAVLFARFLRDFWSGTKPGGLCVWYHVHRTCNLIAIVLMIASFICIMISKGWTWTGPGSSSKYYTKVHTLTGLLALILAWLQPLISLVRCSPSDRRRPMFNWTHRLIGVVGFTLATVAFSVAALEFRIWPQHVLQLVLVLSPAFLLVGLSILFIFIGYAIDIEEADYESIQSIRFSLVFWTIGVLMALCIWMTVLLANGYAE